MHSCQVMARLFLLLSCLPMQGPETPPLRLWHHSQYHQLTLRPLALRR